MDWFQAWWALFLVPLALRLLGARKSRWRGPVWLDLAIGALLGVAFAWLKLHTFAPVFAGYGVDGFAEYAGDEVDRGLWYISDSIKVCGTIEHLRTGSSEGLLRHPAGLIPAAVLVGRLGLTGALATSAFLATALHTGLLYLLGTLIHSRTAGFVAVLFSCAVAPLALMPTRLTHYPVAAACYLLATTLGVLAWMLRGSLAPLVAGLGVGLALFVDFGGVAVAAPILVVGLLKWAGTRRGTRLVGGLGLALPIVLSWGLARHLTPPEISPFELEVHAMLRDARAKVPNWVARDRVTLLGILPQESDWRPPDWLMEALPDPVDKSDSFLWGYSTSAETVQSVLRVAQLSQASVPPGLPVSVHGEQLDRDRAHEVTPWLPLYITSVVLVVLGFRRRPVFVLGLLFLFAPFASALLFQMRVRLWTSYLIMPFSVLPLAFGLAWAMLALGPSRMEAGAERLGARLRRVAVTVLSCLGLGWIVVGGVPSHISPDAAWRAPQPFMGRATEIYDLLAWMDLPVDQRPVWAQGLPEGMCLRHLDADKAAGRNPRDSLELRIVRWPLQQLR